MSDEKIRISLVLEPKLYEKVVKSSKQRKMTVEEWITKLLQNEEEKLPSVSPIISSPPEHVIQLPKFDIDIPQ